MPYEPSIEDLRLAFRVLQYVSKDGKTPVGNLAIIFEAAKALAMIIVERENTYALLDESVERLNRMP